MFASHYASLIFLRNYKDAQSKQRQIMCDMRKNTKNVNAMEKEINAYKRARTNEIKLGYQNGKAMYSQSLFADGKALAGYVDANGSPDFEKMRADNMMQVYSQELAQFQQNMAQQQQAELALLEQEIEALQERELEPLKQLAEDLEVDKANADQEVEITKSAYEASKKMAQENTKNMWA